MFFFFNLVTFLKELVSSTGDKGMDKCKFTLTQLLFCWKANSGHPDDENKGCVDEQDRVLWTAVLILVAITRNGNRPWMIISSVSGLARRVLLDSLYIPVVL